MDWSFINECWEIPEREMQYVAIEYLKVMKKWLTAADIPNIKKIAQTKSWWDTIDGLDKIVGSIALKDPDVNETLITWSTAKDFWLRRLAIDHQLLRKDKTNPALLETILLNNLGQEEFFINKAIGWCLRDYSKTNPAWVTDFIQKNKDQMAPLSISEGSKYL